MSDNLRDRGARDRSRIDVSEQWELRYWTRTFGVNEEKLKEAVGKVGPMVKDVENYLSRPGA